MQLQDSYVIFILDKCQFKFYITSRSKKITKQAYTDTLISLLIQKIDDPFGKVTK